MVDYVRKDFERWCENNGIALLANGYKHPSEHSAAMWKAWQAACVEYGGSQWRPVFRELPLDGQMVLAYFPNEVDPVCQAKFRDREDNMWLTEHGSWFVASHWMPLPEPPDEVADE